MSVKKGPLYTESMVRPGSTQKLGTRAGCDSGHFGAISLLKRGVFFPGARLKHYNIEEML